VSIFVTDEKTPLPTTIAMTVSAPTITYGNEQAANISVAVSSPYSGTPDGTVSVRAGSQVVCTITLASASGTCTLPPTGLPVGTAQVTASYNGSADFAASASAPASLAVSQATSTTSLSLSAPTIAYGKEQTEQVSVRVSPQYGGIPGGSVAVKSGSTAVCTITLVSGKGNCMLSARKLPAGTHTLVAHYGGSTDFTGSASATKTLIVAKEASKTALTLSATRVTYGKEHAEHLTVTVSPQYSGTPGGKVTVKSGTTVVCTITLVSGKGNCTLSARKLPKGTHTLTARYRGSADFTSSTSAKKTLTVK
jgi:hypothetical protein